MESLGLLRLWLLHLLSQKPKGLKNNEDFSNHIDSINIIYS